ncbi:MAG: D-glycero-beta-D-manno-heptose-7-phosphate kinase [Nitrospiraceae bacterium]|nr:MAG: D-glycero-beta-D-manno-heptose-7-phosphate kinase [Nitrospiraceae bacterium]
MDFKKIISRFEDKNILVIGDIILDHYIWGKVDRISPEAPVPVVEVTRESFLLGGAANVAYNIVSLGGKASVIGINGQDIAGEALMNILLQRGVNCDGIFTENRPTTVKTRVIAHNQQVVRFDREDKKYVDGKILKGILKYINSVILNYDAVIVSDYKKGMISPELVKGIVKKTKPKGMFIAVDPKVGHFDFYKGVSLITPNVMEASIGSNVEIKDDKTLLKSGKSLMKKLSCKAVLITRGEQGMSLFQKEKVSHIPTVARKVYDVTGAGDTVISAFTLAYASGANMEEAAVIANHAAGIVVGEVGTAVTTADQILESFK